MNEYYNILKQIRDTGKDERNKSVTLENMIDSIKKELVFYESFIPDFFSKNGDADSIKKIYKELKNKDIKNKVYNEYTDVPRAFIFYSEYEQGMLKFLSEIMENGCEVSESDKGKINKKLENAHKNNSSFIKSIFGGKNNPQSSCILEEAVSNLEYLIDFVPEIIVFKEKCDDLYEKTKNSKSDKDLIIGGCELYFETVSDYCYNVLNSVLESYLEIQQMISESDNENDGNNNQELVYAVF